MFLIDQCTENISALLDYHLQSLAQRVNSYIKDTNDSYIRPSRNTRGCHIMCNQCGGAITCRFRNIKESVD